MNAWKKRVLLVEDSVFGGAVLADTLRRAGHEVVLADDLSTALAAAQVLRFDAALLDIQVGTDACYPVVSILVARHIPFAFVSAADPATLPPTLDRYPFLRKPIHPDAVVRGCERLWSSSPAS